MWVGHHPKEGLAKFDYRLDTKIEMMKLCQSLKNQSTQQRGNTRNKMEGPASKKTKELPKRANHK
jgi:hypothetical protein